MEGPAPPSKYTEISQRLTHRAEEEMQKGDTLQAFEKAWGAVAHAVKSIAEQRGSGRSHLYLFTAGIGNHKGCPYGDGVHS